MLDMVQIGVRVTMQGVISSDLGSTNMILPVRTAAAPMTLPGSTVAAADACSRFTVD